MYEREWKHEQKCIDLWKSRFPDSNLYCLGLQYRCGASGCIYTPHDKIPHDCWSKKLAVSEMFFWCTVMIAIIVWGLTRG
jgi:hypothetical protein